MKKYLMMLLALVFGGGMLFANPVSVSQAKYVGQQFVQANFEQSRQTGELSLVYTGSSMRGDACFYVFNVGNEGFVIVSADDFFRPILGYSDEGSFDANNINPTLAYLLNNLTERRSSMYVGTPAHDVATEWELVTRNGRLISRNGGRAATYLLQTKWNQDYPYNYYCPAATGGPGGHVYAGCVACAMSQIMKYWNHPVKGTGSHTNPNGGSANFGTTEYDWENMPNSLNNNSPQVQIDAIATLMYQCAVSVNMQWSIEGSGAYSPDVPAAIANYFSYASQSYYAYRDSYSYEDWSNMLKESIDIGWPLYYSGHDPTPVTGGGHAFVSDGYDDADLFHFNFGWGGSGDGFFDFDLIDYNTSDGAIFNFAPVTVYNSTAQAPTYFTVTPAADNVLAADLTWVNPTKTLNNVNLSSIDQIVVKRNGEIIYTLDNPTPGQTVNYTDNTVPRFDCFKYEVYAVCNGSHGKIARVSNVNFGPTCGWTLNITKAAFNGFRGGAIHVYNAAGTEYNSFTVTSSAVVSLPFDANVGHVSFGWSAQTSGASFQMAFTIKDSQNNSVFSYDGQSEDFAEGIFFDMENTCGNAVGQGVPSNVVAIVDDENPNNILVSWDGIDDEGYGYIVYRDGRQHRLIPSATSFVDENAPVGGHCYYVGFLSYGGENGEYSNESCASAGACYPPRNLDFEYTGAAYRIKLRWQKPEPATGLTGYYLYRKYGEDGEYEKVKQFNASATSYTDNTANQEGDYYYKLYAFYQSLDCTSAPANWIYDENQFYLHAYYSLDDVAEYESSQVAIFPNPTTNRFTVEGKDMSHLTVFNAIGQKVYEMDCQGESVEVTLNNVETGVYMVRVSTANGNVTKRITIIK